MAGPPTCGCCTPRHDGSTAWNTRCGGRRSLRKECQSRPLAGPRSPGSGCTRAPPVRDGTTNRTSGPSPLILPVLLRQMLPGVPEGRVWTGEWDGWGNRKRPAGSRPLTVPGRRYHVTATSPRKLLTELNPDRLPDVVWDEAGTFIILADIDLPSTVVGCQKRIAERLLRNPGLEAVRVDGARTRRHLIPPCEWSRSQFAPGPGPAPAPARSR